MDWILLKKTLEWMKRTRGNGLVRVDYDLKCVLKFSSKDCILSFSTSVKSHPLEIFIIILVGGLLFGPLGMIIAVPLYTALKVIFKEFYVHNKIVKALTKNI